jgi:drug/metabolite transporter (DMT)-like permease
MLKYFVIAIAAIILTAFAQILLKLGADKNINQTKWIKHYMSLYILVGYSIFFIVTIVNLYVYKYLPLKYSVILLPLVFFFVTVFSFLFFNEKLTKRKLMSYLLIIVGVVVYNLN